MTRPEPAAISAAIKEAVSGIVKLVVVFGVVQMTTEQFGVLMIAVDAVLGAIMVLFIRSASTPTSAPKLEAGTTVEVTNAAGATTGTTQV